MHEPEDFFRLFDRLRRISTIETKAEPRRLISLGGHDGEICAAKHLELVHAYHLANPYTDLTNSIWGTKYQSNLYVMPLLKLTRKCTVTHDDVKSCLFHRGLSCSVKQVFIKDQFVWLSNIVANVKLISSERNMYSHMLKLKSALSRKNTLPFTVSRLLLLPKPRTCTLCLKIICV